MARLTFLQRAERVLRLLLGLRHAPVARALAAHGFTKADVAEGWALLQRTTRSDLDLGPAPAFDKRSERGLKAWESTWFPIVKATLARRSPKAAEWLFLEGNEDAHALGVKVFLTRWDKLGMSGREGLGAEGRRVKALLRERGLTDDVIAEARVWFTPGAKALGAVADDAPGAFADAEKELWAWYVEWSTIARASITDARLLRALGFRARGAGSDDEASDAERDEPPPQEPPLNERPKRRRRRMARPT